MTPHTELCKIAAKWLLNHKSDHFRCQYTVVEFMTLCEETPDVLGYQGGSQTLLIEVKMSRSDFRADRKKRHRRGNGIGSQRYYLCPEGLIYPNELPKGWGLLYYSDGKIQVEKQSEYFPIRDMDNEMIIMYSIIRRTNKKQVFNFQDQEKGKP